MEEQEIDLRDYINVIIKRKWIILTIFFISVITTAIVSFCMPKVYETGAIVENGFIENEIIKKSDSRDIIASVGILEKVIEEAKIDIPVYKFKKSVEVEDIKNTGYIKIMVRAESPEKVKEICEVLANTYLDYGNKLYLERENLIKERLTKIDEQKEKIKEDITDIEDTINKLSSPETTVSPEAMSKVILLQNILSNYREQVTGLNEQEDDVRAILVNAKEFRIIDSPVVPEYAIEPKKKLNIAISAVVSLIFGIFLAFFIEYWKSPKEKVTT